MPDYIVSRMFVLNLQVAPRPSGPAITALKEANVRLEQSMPLQQSVPAYRPTESSTSSAQARRASNE